MTDESDDKKSNLGDKLLTEDLKRARVRASGILEEQPLLSTGKFWLDMLSGNFGGLFPKSTINELAALKGTGKTTLCLHTIAYNQMLAEQSKTSFRCLYMDWEKNLVRQQDMARALGVDMTDPNFFYRQPSTMEGGAQFIIECLKPHTRKLWLGSDAPLDMVVVDTLAAARPIVEINNKIGGTLKPGYRGKLWAEWCRNAQADLNNEGPAIVVINHLQEQLDFNAKGPPIKRYDSPGSNALKLYASQRYMLTEQVGKRMVKEVVNEFTYEETHEVVGIIVEVFCDKSKVGPPYKKGSYGLKPGRGVDAILNMFFASERKEGALYIGGKNSQFGVPDKLGGPKESCKKLIMGRLNFIDYLRSNREDCARLAANLNELWTQQMLVDAQMEDRIIRVSNSKRSLADDGHTFNEAELVDMGKLDEEAFDTASEATDL